MEVGLPGRELPDPTEQEAPTNQYKGAINIVCVLRKSPHYTVEEVVRLYRGVEKNLSRKFKFICLTDEPAREFPKGINVIKLKHPRWITKQSKLEIFRPDLKLGRTLYIDLDTIICGSLEDICSYDGRWCLLGDLAGRFQINRGTGMMLWDGKFGQEMYRKFVELPEEIRNDVYRVGGGRSDQLFINHNMMLEPHHFQLLWPGQIVSYRIHVQKTGVPRDARIICFHGKVKPCEVEDFRRQFD